MATHSTPVALDKETRSPAISPPANSSVQSWLEQLGLLGYAHSFRNYRNVEDILHCSEADIRDLGVQNGAHRAKMISSLVMIRESSLRRIQPKLMETVTSEKHPNDSKMSSSFTTSCASPQAMTHQESMGHAVNDLVGQIWYHARISRQDAEKLVLEEGMFLVRDSFTQPGDYVLTVFWKGVPLHFVINRITVPGRPKVCYHFEEEPFETVTELIEYYLCKRKPVTASSGVLICSPVAHNTPLSIAISQSPLLNCNQVLSSGDSVDDESAKHKRTGSHPALVVHGNGSTLVDAMTVDRRHGSMPSIANNMLSTVKIAEHSNPAVLGHQRADSEPCLSPPIYQTFSKKFEPNELKEVPKAERSKETGPPKPSRVPTVKKRMAEKPLIVKRNQALYEDDGKDYSDYDQVKSSPRAQNGEELTTNDAASQKLDGGFQVVRRTVLNCPAKEADQHSMVISTLTKNSYFSNLMTYANNIMVADNKPLDSSAFAVMKSLLLENDVVLLARHLTIIDLDLIRVTGSHDFGYGITSGLELVTLPMGRSLRDDIIERHFALKLFVSVIILRCSSFRERAQMMHQWIQMAHELRGCLGNLFGFSAIMEGLMADQVKRLKKSWLALDQEFSTSSFLFKHRLCSFLRGLNEATSALPLQNVTIPHILPLVELMQEDCSALNGGVLLRQIDSLTSDLDSLLAHLDTARIIADQYAIYQKTGQRLLTESRLEQSLLDLLDPRTHLKFLWGSKGVRASLGERFSKSSEVLNVLSEKAEPLGVGEQ